MRLCSTLLPRHIAAQIAGLMLIAVILINAVVAGAFFLIDHEMRLPGHEPCLLIPGPHGPEEGPPHGPESGDPGRPPGPPQVPDARALALIEKFKGELPLCGRPPHRLEQFGPLIGTVIIFTVSVALLGMWATRELVRPLNRIVEDVNRFQGNEPLAQLVEEGPIEIRTLARALNEGRARISNLIAERTRMLAAIGHDLRTPITRLRLRAEFMPNAVEQRRMLADLEHMEALVKGALTYLSDAQSASKRGVIDVSSLLQTIADQYADLGQEIAYASGDALTVRIDPHELQRAVTNLVENALRYGKDPAIVVARNRSGDLEIRVEDSGPGIPAHRREAMMEPFARGDEARNMNDFEGFGLGLSIARVIAQAHGGRLELRDRAPHGLVAALVLPAAAVVSWGGMAGA